MNIKFLEFLYVTGALDEKKKEQEKTKDDKKEEKDEETKDNSYTRTYRKW